MPLVPLASIGLRGRLTQTSQPETRCRAIADVVVLDDHHAARRSRRRRARSRRSAGGRPSPGSSFGCALPAITSCAGWRAGEDPARPVGIVVEQVEALVGREPPREADRQRVGIEARLDPAGRSRAARRAAGCPARSSSGGTRRGAARDSQRAAHSSAFGISSTPSQARGPGAADPGVAEVLVEQVAASARATKVGRCAPFVTCVIGGSTSPGKSGRHISRGDLAVQPADAVAAPADADRERRHAGPAPPRRGRRGRGRGTPPRRCPSRARRSVVGGEELVRARRSRCPAATGVWVVKTKRSPDPARTPRRAARRGRSRRAANSSAASAGWPSFRCMTAGSIPSASQHAGAARSRAGRTARAARRGCPRRAEPTSSAARRRSRAPPRRGGAAARARRRRARPGSAAASRRAATSSLSGVPSALVTRAIGSDFGSDSSQYSCWRPADVEPLPEVAAPVEQADADHLRAPGRSPP